MGAIGGTVKWCYEIKRLRREEKKEEREGVIEDMVKKIEELDREEKRTKGASVSLTAVKPAPGEDPEILAEAWRRFTIRRSKRF